jgi:nucleoside-diphosphate-sugar epimerase
MSTLRHYFTRPVLARIVADSALVQASLAAAYGARFVLVALTPEAVDLHELAIHYVESYGRTALPLAIIALAVFTFDGFYRNGRFYRGPYRYPWIIQAVALVYAGFAALAFLNNNIFQVPRGVVPLGALLTTGAIVGVRTASSWWARVLQREGRLDRRASGPRRIQTVLVIGGAGYIGSALLPLLLKQGYRVRLLDLLLFGTEPITGVLGNPNLEVVQADFRQIDKIVEAMRGVDAVIHLGGIVGDPACAVDEGLTIDINLTATRVLADVAHGEGVERFIFASTCSVYGSGAHVLDEDSPVNPLSLYARTKLASERVLHRMASNEFAPVILRFGTIYGISGRTRFDLVVNLLTAKAVQDGKITVFGGDQWRPFVHVEDAARAVHAALGAPLDPVRDETFNVGSDEQNYTIDRIGQMVAALVPGSEIVQMGSDTDKRDYHVSFKKIRSILDFTPEWTVEDGIAQVRRALLDRKINYADAKYSNLKSFTEEHTSLLVQPERDWPGRLLADTETARSDPKTAPGTVH